MPSFTEEYRQRIEDLELQVARLISDTQLGRAMNGPVWLDGASIVSGTVSAEKLIVSSLEAITVNTGSLNITGNITAAPSFPAVGARIVLNSSGLRGYRDATNTTFVLNTDGSGSIGIGATAMSWNSSGVVSIPKAAIGSLTITDVGSGILGGTYSTAAAGTRVELSTSGIKAYAGTDLFFDLNTTNGTLTLTGNFTVRSAASGERVQILASGGIAGYYDNTNTAFILNTNGSGRLGPADGSNNITWDSSGVSIGGVSLSNGKITAQHLSVSQLSAISNDVGLINAGTINAQNMTIQHLKADSITSGTLIADRISGGTLGGSFNIGSGTNISTSGGKLTFGNDYITDNLIHFTANTQGVAIRAWPADSMMNGYGKVEYEMLASSASVAVTVVRSAVHGTNAMGYFSANANGGGTPYASAGMYARSGVAAEAVDAWVTTSNPAGFAVAIGNTSRFWVTSSGGTFANNLTVNGTLTVGSFNPASISTSTVTATTSVTSPQFNIGANSTYHIVNWASGIEFSAGTIRFNNVTGVRGNTAWANAASDGYIQVEIKNEQGQYEARRIPLYKTT